MVSHQKPFFLLILPEHTASSTSDVIHVSSGEHLHFDLRPQTSHTYDVVTRIDGLPDRGYPMIVAQSSNGSIIPVALNHNGPSDEFRMQLSQPEPIPSLPQSTVLTWLPTPRPSSPSPITTSPA